MTAGQRCPAFALGAETDERDLFVGNPELAQSDARDVISAGAELADGDSFAFQVGWLFDRRRGDKDVVEFVAGGANGDKILSALRPGGNHAGAALLHHVDVFGDQRLDRFAPAAHEDRQDFNAMLFKRTGFVGHPEKTGGAAESVGHAEFFQGFGLGEEGRGNQQQAENNATTDSVLPIRPSIVIPAARGNPGYFE